MNRCFIEKDLLKGEIIKIEKKEFSHLFKVLRTKKTDFIEIVNGKNILAKAEIVEIFSKNKNKNKNFALLKILDIYKAPAKKTSIILALSFIAQKKLEFVVEKATELGVSKFILFLSKNSDTKKININLERLKSILISAIKQCKRLDLPKIKIFEKIEDFTNLKKENFDIYFGDISKQTEPLKISKNKNILIFIGPEKGFEKEEKKFLENFLKAKKISINKNILRSETAAIAFSAIFSNIIY